MRSPPSRVLNMYSAVFGHWPPFLLVLVTTLLAQMAYSMITPTLPLYLRYGPGPFKTPVPVIAIGFIFFAYAVTETLFKAPGGVLGDKWGRVRLLVIGLLLGTISPILMTVAGRWELFVPLRAVDGLGVALVWPTMMALIGERVPRGEKALAMSAFNIPYLGGLVLGMAAGLEIGDLLGDNRYVFYASSVLLLLSAGCAIGLGFWERSRRARIVVQSSPLPTKTEELPEVLSRTWWQRLRRLREERGTLLHMLWLFVIVQGAASLLVPIMTLYARDVLSLTQSEMVKIFVVPGIVAAVLAMPLGRLADRMGRARIIRLGLALGAIGLLTIPLAGSQQWLVVVLMTLLGIAYVAVMPSWMALTSELAPPHRQGLALGAMNTAQGLGFLTAVLVGAVLYEQVAETAPFYLGGLLLVLCTVASGFLIRTPPAPVTQD